ncbi:hypothetical protein FQN55_002241 [Onygenales sp. PD_40]|nr:hypothetical protein FQN55_002241 [Onygenales sp. PD_40]
MAPDIPSAKITLSCPLFGVDFDPRNNGFLLVGGGGGEGRSGALLNTSRRNEISEVVDIELSRDEDSVTSLAISRANDNSIVALAGINSSVAEQQRDNNEHLRAFRIDYPPRKEPEGTGTVSKGKSNKGKKNAPPQQQPKSTPLSRTSLFRPQYSKPTDKRETYQRLIRLSPWKGEGAQRIGAVATGMAPKGEMVVFNATSPTPDVLGRIRLDGREEVEDVDMLPPAGDDDGKFKVAYTDGTSIYTFKVSASAKSNAAPKTKTVYTSPYPDYFAGNKKRSKIRALRFLSPTSFLVLQNLPDRAGCELVIISLGLAPEGTIVRRTRLPRSMKIGLGLDVCHLSESPMGEKQFIIAVSGNDNTIQLFTLEYAHKSTFSKFRPYTTLRNVHPFSMTRLTFSTFLPPPQPISPEVRPQYVKLASISVGNTVVVHTFPLSPSPAKSRHPRYVLVQPGPSDLLQTVFSSVMALIVVALGAFFLQAFTEIRGGVPPTLGAVDWLTPRLREMIARPYIFEHGLPAQYQKWRSGSATPSSSISTSTTTVTSTMTATSVIPVVPVIETPSRNLRDLLSSLSHPDPEPEAAPPSETPPPPPVRARILVEEHPHDSEQISLTTVPHDGEQQPDDEASDSAIKHRKWEDLHESEREAWKDKLSRAGHWAVDEGEAVLRGVFFGNLAGFVAAVVD